MEVSEALSYLNWIDSLHDELINVFKEEIDKGATLDVNKLTENLSKKQSLMQEIENAFKTIEQFYSTSTDLTEDDRTNINNKIEMIRRKVKQIIELNTKTIEIFKTRKDAVSEKLQKLRSNIEGAKKYKWLKENKDKPSMFDSKDYL